MNHTANDYGLYNISMTIDGRQIYGVKFDRLDFNNGRYVNAFTDYAEKKRSGKIINAYSGCREITIPRMTHL